MVLFSITSAVLEIGSAIAYFVVDKSVRGIGRILFGSGPKIILYFETKPIFNPIDKMFLGIFM